MINEYERRQQAQERRQRARDALTGKPQNTADSIGGKILRDMLPGTDWDAAFARLLRERGNKP